MIWCQLAKKLIKNMRKAIQIKIAFFYVHNYGTVHCGQSNVISVS
jgi:hypothetical protein